MNKRWFYVIVLVLVMAAVWLFQNGTESQATDEMLIESLAAYETTLVDSYTDLNLRFEEFKESGDYEAWKAYSSEWLVGISNSKSPYLEQESAEKHAQRIQELDAGRKLLYDVWSDYNKDLKGTRYNANELERTKERLDLIFEK